MGKQILDNKFLENIGQAIKSAGDFKDGLMSKLSNEEKLKINKFESDYILLVKSGDIIGAQKLAEKFKAENK